MLLEAGSWLSSSLSCQGTNSLPTLRSLPFRCFHHRCTFCRPNTHTFKLPKYSPLLLTAFPHTPSFSRQHICDIFPLWPVAPIARSPVCWTFNRLMVQFTWQVESNPVLFVKNKTKNPKPIGSWSWRRCLENKGVDEDGRKRREIRSGR